MAEQTVVTAILSGEIVPGFVVNIEVTDSNSATIEYTQMSRRELAAEEIMAQPFFGNSEWGRRK